MPDTLSDRIVLVGISLWVFGWIFAISYLALTIEPTQPYGISPQHTTEASDANTLQQ